VSSYDDWFCSPPEDDERERPEPDPDGELDRYYDLADELYQRKKEGD